MSKKKIRAGETGHRVYYRHRRPYPPGYGEIISLFVIKPEGLREENFSSLFTFHIVKERRIFENFSSCKPSGFISLGSVPFLSR